MKYTFKRDDLELDCELDYIEEEVGFMEDGLQVNPTIPADMVLISAQIDGMELYEVLAEWFVADIENAALMAHLGRGYA